MAIEHERLPPLAGMPSLVGDGVTQWRWPLTDGRTIVFAFDEANSTFVVGLQYIELSDKSCDSCKRQLPIYKRSRERMVYLESISIPTLRELQERKKKDLQPREIPNGPVV